MTMQCDVRPADALPSKLASAKRSRVSSQVSDAAIGLSAVVIFPATFWTGLMALAAYVFEFPFSLTSGVFMFSALTAFLTVIYGVMARQNENFDNQEI